MGSLPDMGERLRQLGPTFWRALAGVAQRTGVDLDALCATIQFESGFKAQARNTQSRATGLIQFMPDTAKLYKTTIDDLFKMTELEQLPYVEKHFTAVKKRFPNLQSQDVCLSVLMPAHVGKSNDTVIMTKLPNEAVPPKDAYGQNKNLDTNKDGEITVGEVRQRYYYNLLASVANRPRLEFDDQAPDVGAGGGSSSAPTKSQGAIVIVGLGVAAAIAALFRRIL